MQFIRKRRVDAHVDMVPMIDGLLQLFILLMMNMSFVASAVRLELPTASEAPSQTSSEAIVVVLDASGQLYLNDAPLGRGDLADRVAALTGGDTKRSVTLRADSALKYDEIVKALVAIQQAGVTQIHLAYEGES
jgi:biopolymer transport protein ExbD